MPYIIWLDMYMWWITTENSGGRKRVCYIWRSWAFGSVKYFDLLSACHLTGTYSALHLQLLKHMKVIFFISDMQSSNVGIGGDGVHPHRTEVILRMKCYSCVVSKHDQNDGRSWIPFAWTRSNPTTYEEGNSIIIQPLTLRRSGQLIWSNLEHVRVSSMQPLE